MAGANGSRNGFSTGSEGAARSIGTLRTQIEADLLLQNLMLVATRWGSAPIFTLHQSTGAARRSEIYRPVRKMLGFEFVTPAFKLLDVFVGTYCCRNCPTCAPPGRPQSKANTLSSQMPALYLHRESSRESMTDGAIRWIGRPSPSVASFTELTVSEIVCESCAKPPQRPGA